VHISVHLAYDDLLEPVCQLSLSDTNAASFGRHGRNVTAAVVTAMRDAVAIGNVVVATVRLLGVVAVTALDLFDAAVVTVVTVTVHLSAADVRHGEIW